MQQEAAPSEVLTLLHFLVGAMVGTIDLRPNEEGLCHVFIQVRPNKKRESIHWLIQLL